MTLYNCVVADPPWLEKGPMHRPVPTRDMAVLGTFYSMVEQNSPDPRLELFSRLPRLGWDVWGDQVDGVPLGLLDESSNGVVA